MTPSIGDLYLAYRQAKSAVYYERRGVGLLAFAEFEAALATNLSNLRAHLAGTDGWFGGLPIGEVFVTPKRLRLRDISSEEVIRVGDSAPARPTEGLDVQLRLAASPQFAIVEVLYLWRFGGVLDAILSAAALGYRLDLRGGQLARTRRWLFEYWPRRYQEFRTAPLDIARAELRAGSVVVISADLESYYDTVHPGFLVNDRFVAELVARNPLWINRPEYLVATRSLLDAYERYWKRAAQLTGLPWRMGLPIGALTSRVVANVALASLDDAIVRQPHVAGYRRYVDDFVIVGKANASPGGQLDETLRAFLPGSAVGDEAITLDSTALGRPGSDFRLRRGKTRVIHLDGVQGEDFLAAIGRDFRALVSERRAFLDTSTLIEDTATRLISASKGEGVLRVLRDADRAKLEHFALENALRALERVSLLADPTSALRNAEQTLHRLSRFLRGADDWVENLDLGLRLLRLASDVRDAHDFRHLCDWMDNKWGTTEALTSAAVGLFHRERRVSRRGAWTSLRNYLHARRIEAVCSALRVPAANGVSGDWVPDNLRDRTRSLGKRALVGRARLLAAADLRARDREDDSSSPEHSLSLGDVETAIAVEEELSERFLRIHRFIEYCSALGDRAWVMSPAKLFLCTRPPSYFDVARRLLYRVETEGFSPAIFQDLLDVVNAIRGTAYRRPVGRVIDDETAAIGLDTDGHDSGQSRLILGNLVVSEEAFEAAATRVAGSATGQPLLSIDRLKALAHVLHRSGVVAREGRASRDSSSLLVLPELSIPRAWFRALASHVAGDGSFSLVMGLEYLHDPAGPWVANQVYAVLPGPFRSVATWPWTKRLPAREEARNLSRAQPPVAFRKYRPPQKKRTVVSSPHGRFSVLVCSELLECRLTSDLLGRVELVLSPSWNRATASYDHLLRSVALQLHAIVGVANNGHYSDCRAWAPRHSRWERDLCRLLQRDMDDIVVVDLPLRSLRKFHSQLTDDRVAAGGEPGATPPAAISGGEREWQPLPPDWP